MNETLLSRLRESVGGYLSDRRMAHVLSVEEECARLGEIYLPEKVEKLRIAGILHDITKEFPVDRQTELMERYGIPYDKKYFTPAVLHAKTGAYFAAETFPEAVDDEIRTAIFRHTSADEEMTLFDALVYLADYIEPTRTFSDCVTLRSYFYDGIARGEDKLSHLRATMIYSLDLMLSDLIRDGKYIDQGSVAARNALIADRNFFR